MPRGIQGQKRLIRSAGLIFLGVVLLALATMQYWMPSGHVLLRYGVGGLAIFGMLVFLSVPGKENSQKS